MASATSWSPRSKEWIANDGKGNNTLLRDCAEGSIDFVLGTRFQQVYLPSYRAARRLHVLRLCCEIWALWIQKCCNWACCRHNLVQQPESFRLQLRGHYVDASSLATRSVEAGDEPFLDGIFAGREPD